MNEITAIVTKIIGEFFEEGGMWFIKVESVCWGQSTIDIIGRLAEDEIKQIHVGMKFSK